MTRESRNEDWDAMASSFPLEGHALWRQHSDRVNRALLDAWLPADVNRLLKTDLFDEAVSEGLYPFLATRAAEVEGIDVSAQAVGTAAGKYPQLVARQADLRSLPFEDGRFDCVVSNSTLDHFNARSDIFRGLAELYRVTRPGGHLIVTLDNPRNPVVWLRNHLPQRVLRHLGLVPYFVGETLSRSGLEAALRDCGFEVLESGAVLHCPRVFAVARASALQERGDAEAQQRFLERLARWERLQRWPSRWFTGHFVAARARRPE